MAGVEGYVESAALGYLAGVIVARRALGLSPEAPPADTAHGALLGHLQRADARHFQPMNVNYGLFPPLDREAMSEALRSVAVNPDAVRASERRRSGRKRKLPKHEKNQMFAERALASIQDYRARVVPRKVEST
jgi:methylenetetrahydrofolate--tRNA-(uracil-5-)-methyltransferase